MFLFFFGSLPPNLNARSDGFRQSCVAREDFVFIRIAHPPDPIFNRQLTNTPPEKFWKSCYRLISQQTVVCFFLTAVRHFFQHFTNLFFFTCFISIVHRLIFYRLCKKFLATNFFTVAAVNIGKLIFLILIFIGWVFCDCSKSRNFLQNVFREPWESFRPKFEKIL